MMYSLSESARGCCALPVLMSYRKLKEGLLRDL